MSRDTVNVGAVKLFPGAYLIEIFQHENATPTTRGAWLDDPGHVAVLAVRGVELVVLSGQGVRVRTVVVMLVPVRGLHAAEVGEEAVLTRDFV